MLVQINGKAVGSLRTSGNKLDMVEKINGKHAKIVVVQDKLMNIIVRDEHIDSSTIIVLSNKVEED